MPTMLLLDKGSGFVTIVLSHRMFPDILLAIRYDNFVMPLVSLLHFYAWGSLPFMAAVKMPKGIDFEGQWDHCRRLSTPSPMNEPR